MGAASSATLKKISIVDKGGRPPVELALILDALFFRLRNCGPWRDLPSQYGCWQTIYGWHRAFARNGIWLILLKGFMRKVKSAVVLVDGTHVVAHQSAANPAGGAAAQAMGKTRGGRNTKVMALTDRQGRLLNFVLAEGQTYEGKHVRTLLPKDRKWKVVGDKGFDSDKLRRQLESLGHKTCFPGKKNRRKKIVISKTLYRQRYRVENFFCRIKRWACLSHRRDKLAAHFASLLAFAAVIDWMQPLKRF